MTEPSERRAPALLPTTAAPTGEEDARKAKLTVVLPAQLVEDLRNTVVALSGPPYRLTLAAVVRSALESELSRLRDDRIGRARGRRFPQRLEGLRAGRPISSTAEQAGARGAVGRGRRAPDARPRELR